MSKSDRRRGRAGLRDQLLPDGILPRCLAVAERRVEHVSLPGLRCPDDVVARAEAISPRPPADHAKHVTLGAENEGVILRIISS